MAYICIGVPYWIGEYQQISAVDAVHQSGIAEKLGAEWIDVQPAFEDNADPVVAVNRALADVIKQHSDKTPLIFAADCVSALGALKGLEEQRPAVIWYDAHGDFNTPDTTPSGFLGGMPLAALVGRGNETLMQEIGLSPLRESDIIITDARDLDPDEALMLANSDLIHLPDVRELMNTKMPEKPVYIHLDTDVVTLKEMPAMNYPSSGGPTLEDTLQTVHYLRKHGKIAGVLFSLWNQEKDGADKALESTLRLVDTLVG